MRSNFLDEKCHPIDVELVTFTAQMQITLHFNNYQNIWLEKILQITLQCLRSPGRTPEKPNNFSYKGQSLGP